MNGFRKVGTLLSVDAAVGVQSRMFAGTYDELAEKGYRWISTDDPYACPFKEDLRQIIRHRTDETVIPSKT